MNSNNFEDPIRKDNFTHLTDHEFDLFLDESLEQVVLTRVEVHLDLCLFCSKRLEFLRAERNAFGQPVEATTKDIMIVRSLIKQKGQKPPSDPPLSLRERLLKGIKALGGNILSPDLTLDLVPSLADNFEWPIKGQLDDGLLRWSINEDKEENIIMRFASNNLGLAKIELKVKAGRWERNFILVENQSATEVRAEIKLTRDEREKFAPEELRIIVTDPPPSIDKPD